MELLVISESQIKLTLTPDDLGRYPPDAEEGALLRAILRDACRIGSNAPMPAGFSDRGGRLFVQMYPSRVGGCELFVTRLPAFCSHPDGSGERGTLRDPSTAGCGGPIRRAVYLFGELDLLLRCCSALSRIADGDGMAESAAFADENRRGFYLVLPEENPSVAEYLGSLCPNASYSYINEHCVPICGGDAVRTLGGLA